MNVDDEPGGIGQQESRVVGDIIDFEYYPRHRLLILRDADFPQEPVVHLKALAHERGPELGVVQIEENAVGARDPPRLVTNFVFQVDHHSRVVGSGPIADIDHLLQGSRPDRRNFRNY